MPRPKKEQVYMDFAIGLSKRATCQGLTYRGNSIKVGAVITTNDLTQVLGVGYNGNYAGGPNGCDNPQAQGEARCGCIHAEMNAIAKCDNSIKDKVLFLTCSPCALCSKLIINSGFSKVFIHDEHYFKARHDGTSYNENIVLLKNAKIGVFIQNIETGEFRVV